MDFGIFNYFIFLATLAGIYAILALGLNVQWGFSGLFNAGIAGFFAVGGYTSAILTSPEVAGRVGGYDLPSPIGWVGAMLLAALIAWPIGKICLRFRSDYLAIATIGVAEVIRMISRAESWLTGGPTGITRIPRPFSEFSYGYSGLAWLFIVLALVGLCYWLVERQYQAPWGRMMRAIRDNEIAASAMGKDVPYRRLEAFVFGSALMGLAGALFVHFNRVITPEAIDPMQVTFLVWIMLILGGSGNNRGAVLGAFVIWAIWSMSELLTDRLPQDYALTAKYLRMFVIGLALQLVLRFRPEGLLPEPVMGTKPAMAEKD